MRKALPGEFPIYFVTDHALNGKRTKIEVIAEVLKGGVKLIQYRDKELSDADFLTEASIALTLCRNAGATMLINDRVHLAAELGADGVHLGQEDFSPLEARKLLGPSALIGLSTHNEAEVIAAKGLPLDYINIGPMFATQTKQHLTHLGMEEVLRLSRLTPFHWTTMGGIGLEQISKLLTAGVKTVSMVTALSLAESVEQATRKALAQTRPYFQTL